MKEEINNKKYYTFTFGRYEHDRLERQRKLYFKNLFFKLKVFGAIGGTIFVLGCVKPILIWFDYDINVFKPKMSEYLKNRLK